jgi:hypothetical protein
MLLFFASMGGVVAGLLRRRQRAGIATHLCVLILPLVLPQIETYYPAPLQIRTVRNEIKIAAPALIVRKNIASVNPIRRDELPKTWTERLGFPRPISATLSYEGIGGIRNATFERGLSFIETVTAWKPKQQLSFTIKADTAQIPATTLDEHATIGGPYFDVLTGEYDVEEISPGMVVLHLTTQERLTTDFNSYAALWTDAVMGSIQESILQVIKKRCERTTVPGDR